MSANQILAKIASKDLPRRPFPSASPRSHTDSGGDFDPGTKFAFTQAEAAARDGIVTGIYSLAARKAPGFQVH